MKDAVIKELIQKYGRTMGDAEMEVIRNNAWMDAQWHDGLEIEKEINNALEAKFKYW